MLTKKLSQFKRYFPLLVLISLALFLRAYRIDILTTFGRDQGIDFLVVRDMIINQKLTLIGIKTSVADFYQGPNYLYILLPFFWAFNLHPLAGAVSALFISALTIIVLYVFCLKFLSQRAAVLSSTLFAVSPELVKFGNTPLYQHFLPLFIFLSLFMFFQIHQKPKVFNFLLLGFFLGFALELHFLAISLVLAVLVYLLIFKNNLKQIGLFLFGLILGLAPTIVFELRHGFLNTNYLYQYLLNRSNEASISPDFTTWLTGAGLFLGANSIIIGLAPLARILLALFTSWSPNYLKRLLIPVVIISVIFSLFISPFPPHYLLPFWCIAIIVLPLLIPNLKTKISFGLVSFILLSNFIASTSNLHQDHGYSMPHGWSLKKILEVADIIKSDSGNKNWRINVASLLDGDTRSYPLRYSLAYKQVSVDGVEEYPKSNSLYVVARNNPDQVLKSNVWEITSLAPFTMTQTWNLQDGVILYRLDRQNDFKQ